jgi:hypothetical protein
VNPDLTFQFSDLDPPMRQNDSPRLPPFHFDADLDPALHFDADADLDPAFHFDAGPDKDLDPAFQNNADPGPRHCLKLKL